MFENPIIFSLFLSTIITIGYIIYIKYKKERTDIKENNIKENNINKIIIFSFVFIFSFILNLCFTGEKSNNKSGGSKSYIPPQNISTSVISHNDNRINPPF